ncbi:hypothetical protein [Belliella buryatensis]|uniref:hypothetical protein n=1 Tax=Belliella buryatensis TaxID=1500549 RepID=UPI000B78AAEF|nr:hypothetical protein [Belliella buryatensis]
MQIFKKALIFLLISTLAIAGYFFYNSSYWKGRINALELVAADAVFVFETKEPVMAWNQLVTQPLWARISELPSVKHAESQLLGLDSLVGRSGNLDRSLKGNQLVVSLHNVGKEEFDFLFTLSFAANADRSFVQSLEDNLPELSQINTRNYSQIPIYEFQSVNLERNLSYAKINNVLVASYSSFLVEEAIRLHQNSSVPNFKTAHPELLKSLESPTGLGVFRLTSEGLAKLLLGISRNEQLGLVQQFAVNQMSGNFELKFAEGKFQLEGETFFKKDSRPDFSKGIGDFKVSANLIPNRTAALFRYNFRTPAQFGQLKNLNFQPKSTYRGEIEKKLIEKDFLRKLTGNAFLILMETPVNQQQDKVLLLKTAQIEDQLELLKSFVLETENVGLDNLPTDLYLNQEIFVISTEEFPGHLMEGKFVGFEDTYITSLGEYLVFANSSKSMKVFLDDYRADNTWGKNLQQKRFVGSLDTDSGFSFVLNIPRVWNALLDVSSPNWKVFFEKYGPQLRTFDLLGLSVKDTERDLRAKMDLLYALGPIKTVQGITLTENRSINFSNRLVYGPKTIENFNDGSTDFVVQDELHQFHLITGEGELVFTLPLESPIVSEIYQIDYFKNGKLQILFATENRLYLVDRLGNMIGGYPLEVPGRKLTHLNVVDYDNTRDYRFFIATDQAELFLFNKSGDALEAWDPKEVSANLAVKPAHRRIAGVGDQMLALTLRGDLYFFNRRGEVMLDSPVNLGAAVNSDYIVLERGNAVSSRIVTVTEDGEVVSVNFQGEIAYRNQLPRPDRESKFFLVRDQKEDNYIFAIHEFNKVTIMDAAYKPLFSHNLISEEIELQLFSFGLERQILVLIDKTQEFTYLFDLSGQMLNTLPISSKIPIDIRYSSSQNEYRIFASSGNSLVEYRLPL